VPEPQRRRLRQRAVPPRALWAEPVWAVPAEGPRSRLRHNAAEARHAPQRLPEQLTPLQPLGTARQAQGAPAPRGPPAARGRGRQAGGKRSTRRPRVSRALDARPLLRQIDAAAPERALPLAGCAGRETDVPSDRRATPTAQARDKARAHVARDLRTLPTGRRARRPLCGRQDTRPRGHVCVGLLALPRRRALPRRGAATCGPTHEDPHGGTLPEALDALPRLGGLPSPLDAPPSLPRLPRPDAQHTRRLQALQVALPRQGACRQAQRPLGIATRASCVGR
jgi:hypothetical protein